MSMIALALAGLTGFAQDAPDDDGGRYQPGVRFSCLSWKSWVEDVAAADLGERQVHFTWARNNNYISMYAAMTTVCEGECPDDGLSNRLYASVSRATHYWTLDTYAYRVAECFDPGVAAPSASFPESEPFSAASLYQGNQVDIVWNATQCAFGADIQPVDQFGCTSIRVTPPAGP